MRINGVLKFNWRGVGLIAAVLAALFAHGARADTVALSISTSNRGDDTALNASVGWQFTVNKAIIVTELGVWDGLRRSGAAGGGSTPAGGGLGEAHTVTIWDANGSALAQATVPAGTAGNLVDVFRYVSLPSPVTLLPGTYTIGAYYAGNSPTPDSDAFFADPIVTAPELSYDTSMYWTGAGSPPPGSSSPSFGYFGPNFLFEDAPQVSGAVPANAVIGLVANVNNLYVTAENAGNSPLIANRGALGLWEQFRVEDRGDGYIALRSIVNGLYVCAENAGASPLIANRTAVGVWEQFLLIDAGGGQFALKSKANGKYVTAENAGNNSLIANRDAIGTWERFNLFVTIRATINNKLVVAENAGNSPLIANRDAIGIWEQFQFVNASPGYFALVSKANGLVVCAENAGNSPLIANRTAIGTWEQFQWMTVGNGNFALKALVNGLFVTAENAGNAPLIANRTAAQSWEQFH